MTTQEKLQAILGAEECPITIKRRAERGQLSDSAIEREYTRMFPEISAERAAYNKFHSLVGQLRARVAFWADDSASLSADVMADALTHDAAASCATMEAVNANIVELADKALTAAPAALAEARFLGAVIVEQYQRDVAFCREFAERR